MTDEPIEERDEDLMLDEIAREMPITPMPPVIPDDSEIPF